MNRKRLNNLYFHWLCHFICSQCTEQYHKLLKFLYAVDFTYTLPMDSNRAGDGVNLRYRFGYENGYDHSVIASDLDIRPCSVLEMMVALAVRCEEHIMNDPEIGDRTSLWFWNMVSNLYLMSMDDLHFNRKYVSDRINTFLERTYAPDGKGSLFTVRSCRHDMRKIEIWYQLMQYLIELEQK